MFSVLSPFYKCSDFPMIFNVFFWLIFCFSNWLPECNGIFSQYFIFGILVRYPRNREDSGFDVLRNQLNILSSHSANLRHNQKLAIKPPMIPAIIKIGKVTAAIIVAATLSISLPNGVQKETAIQHNVMPETIRAFLILESIVF